MASLSTCHLGLWLGWQILLNLVKNILFSSSNTFPSCSITAISTCRSRSLECYLANLPKDTPHVKKCALSFKLSIVLVGNLSHCLSNKCIECNECCNVYRMSYIIVVHTTMKRQTTTKKGRASLNADDLIKKKILLMS